MEIDRRIVQTVPYNIYHDEWPGKINDSARNFIRWSSELLNQAKLETISTVVITNYTFRDYRPTYLYLYTFGNFRKHYTVLKKLSKLIAPVYMEVNILPIIKPVLSREWNIQENNDGRIYIKVHKQGVLAYSIEELA